MAQENTGLKADSTIARTDDGTIQITFTIPFETIKENREKAAKTLSEGAQVPGFRRGKAPVDKVMEHVSQNTLLEKTLSYILPDLLSKAIEKHNIKPIIYPKFELVKAAEGEDWQIRAVTCEAPEVKLGDYKKNLAKFAPAKTNEIWTPGSPHSKTPDKQKEPSREEKEQNILKGLVENIDIKIPKVLISEEADSRLSNLLSRLEKLGLSLESYLASTGKTAQNLRSEYEKQSSEGLALDFILSKIAEEEKLEVDPSEIEASIKALGQDETKISEIDTPQRRKFIENIIKRRKALDSLLSLI